MLTIPFVGDRTDFVIVSAGWVIVTLTDAELVAPPTLAAVAEFAAGDATLVAVNETEILVVIPDTNAPRLVQINVPALITFGEGVADWKLKALGKLSVTDRLFRVVLPLLMTCRLYWTVWPTCVRPL